MFWATGPQAERTGGGQEDSGQIARGRDGCDTGPPRGLALVPGDVLAKGALLWGHPDIAGVSCIQGPPSPRARGTAPVPMTQMPLKPADAPPPGGGQSLGQDHLLSEQKEPLG